MAEVNKTWFHEKFETLDMSEVYDKTSPWGNYFLNITDEQLNDLKTGKVLYHDDEEYGIFIILGGS